MNFRQLEYIIAVDKHRNFNRAAIECNVAQSTLSMEIQRLERKFDIIIFDRSRTPVVPTLKGKDLIQKAKEIRVQQRLFEQIALERENEVSGMLHLAIAEIIAPYIAPIFIKSISKKYPKLDIKIYELSDRRIEDFLFNEEIDAALMIAPSLTHGYYEQKLYEEELCLYATTKLSDDTRSLPISSIDFNSVMLHEDMRDILVRQVDSLGSKSSELLEKRTIKYVKGNLETLRNIINLNGGSMLLPKISLGFLSQENLEKVYFIQEKKLKLPVSLVTSRGFEKKRIIKRLTQDISDILTMNDQPAINDPETHPL
ncbi:MAG: LysR family transcriptional regulator [Bacteroidota bacterium]